LSTYFQFDEGKDGERNTRRYCYQYLKSDKYRQYHDVLITSSTRSTQIDHIIVSEYGIFVIETKTMNGWIYGDADSSRWTQVFNQKKYIFQNPLRQNYLHTKTLSNFLNIEHDKFFSIIVFWGDCVFQTSLPENVTRSAFINYIRQKKLSVLTKDEMNRVCLELHRLKENTSQKDTLDYLHSIKNTEICPRCGGKLKQRTVKRGGRTGTKFTGCSNFPKCNFTRNLESE
jgi:restriction system protein